LTAIALNSFHSLESQKQKTTSVFVVVGKQQSKIENRFFEIMFGVNNQKGEAAKLVDSVEVDAKVLLAANDGSPKKELIGSIDQGTSSTRFLLFTKEGRIAAWAQLETTQIFPTSQPYMVGWHEQDPFGIWGTVVKCIRAVIEAMDKQLKKHSYSVFQSYSISAIGITNQRESTIAWNSETGQVYYNAIIWDDTRTVEIAKNIAGTGGKDKLRPKTGLPLASYFAGTKVRWLLDNVQALREDLSTKPETVRFGTVDTWVLYQLTGAPAAKKANPLKNVANVGGVHVTDVSNASRWLFLDIDTVEWDEGLVEAVCGPHKVPLTALPKVMASSEVYGTLKKESTGVAKLEGVPVSAILGDQQAALCESVFCVLLESSIAKTNRFPT
jgi:glycerol kinase